VTTGAPCQDDGDNPPRDDGTTEYRRAVPRQPVNWNARYRFTDDPATSWRICRVADVSTAGAGLRLFGITPDEPQDRQIEVLVQLRGEVRNSVPGTNNDVRAGVEFEELTGDAASFVESLRTSTIRW